MGRRLSLLIVGLFVVLACGETDRVPTPSRSTPVILISIDTLRSDRLPAYGYTGIETPHLDRFRRDAILYEKAYSHYPLTLPSHASILSGLLPADHGVRDNIGYLYGEDVPTLPEILKAGGYATGAAVSTFVLRKETGIARGFDFYDDDVEPITDHQALGLIQRGGDATAKVASRWIAEQEKPVFFMLHVYEPHTPYDPPEPYRSRYTDRYDGEVAWTDTIIGGFLDDLRAQGIYDDALIMIFSDHGEGLGDHGEEEHGLFLYREIIQVPLLVKLPQSALAGTSVSSPAQLVDIFPTVLERTGLQTRELQQGEGMSLISLVRNAPAEPRHIYSESYYPRLHFGWSDLHSLTDGTHHYIHAPRPELYHLDEDPLEQYNILESNRRTYYAMRDRIEPYVRAAEAPAAIDPEEAAKLAALGYLGSTVRTEPGEELPDPKDKLDTFRDITRAFSKFREGDLAESLVLIERHLEENRRIVDLWNLKAKVLRRLGRHEEAIASAQEALKLSPTLAHVAIEIAELYLDIRRLDEAEQHADLVRRSEPAQAHELFARIAIERGDLELAEREARLAVDAARNKTSPLITLARIKRDQGRVEEALDVIERAFAHKKEKQTFRGLHFTRGDLMARIGRGDEAESDFREEIRLFPLEPQPYKNLVLVLAAQGRLKEATQVIHDLVEASPTPPAYIAVVETHDVLGDERGARYWARRGLEQFPNNDELRRLASGGAARRGAS
jgi:arylsulfatase A-like enzyme/Flp pilus assembly protein TadD